MSAADGFEMSKSAKKRAAKKSRDGAHEEAEVAAAPAPAKVAAPAAAAPKAKAGAAKAQPAAVPAPAARGPLKCSCGAMIAAESNFCNMCGAKRPDAAAAAPKADTKAQPKKSAAAEKAPPAQQPKAEPKKAAAKKKAEPQPEPPKMQEGLSHSFEDDGTGGDWGVATGASKKKEKQQAKKQAEGESKPTEVTQQAQKAAAKAPSAGPPAKKQSAGSSMGVSLVERIQQEAEQKALAKAAQKRADAAIQQAAGEDTSATANFVTAQVPCPQEKIGRIVGPKGANLEMLKEKTGVAKIDTAEGMVTLIGEPDAVKKAEVAVREMVEKGFMSIQYDNFGEQSVMVHPVNFPNIIGPKGAIIQKIKKELSVEINIPQGIAKDANGKYGKKKYPISIAGSSESVEKAKEVVNDIVYYSHHPITHPDIIHKEMEVEEWTYKFVIGPKGSEMRHIQNSFKVAVSIPRDNHAETGANPNLLLVGLAEDVEKAKKYIEKLINNAEQNQGGREKKDEAMGDERDANDVVDPAAAQYLYKRT